tara:strand:+ start:3077 stop:3331 length:255 start_codon:yes stop_codon:yes gene_type:complete
MKKKTIHIAEPDDAAFDYGHDAFIDSHCEGQLMEISRDFVKDNLEDAEGDAETGDEWSVEQVVNIKKVLAEMDKAGTDSFFVEL